MVPHLDIIELIKAGGILMVGSLIQSSSGFGFGLLAVPLFLLMGFPLPETVIVIVIGSAIQKVIAVGYLRRSADWRGHRRFMAVSLAALPLGVFLMYKVSFMNHNIVKQVIGGLVLFLLLLQWKGVIKAKEKVADIWGYVAGFLSGILNGLANIGGPPLVLWILAHRWSNEQMRVTPIAFSIVLVPFQLLFMLLTFGDRLWTPLLKGLLLAPLVFLGSWVGLKIGAKISRDHLKLYMRILLFLIAGSALINPLFAASDSPDSLESPPVNVIVSGKAPVRFNSNGPAKTQEGTVATVPYTSRPQSSARERQFKMRIAGHVFTRLQFPCAYGI